WYPVEGAVRDRVTAEIRAGAGSRWGPSDSLWRGKPCRCCTAGGRAGPGSGVAIAKLEPRSQISKLLLSGRIRSATIVVSSIKDEKLAMKGAAFMVSASHGAVNKGFVR